MNGDRKHPVFNSPLQMLANGAVLELTFQNGTVLEKSHWTFAFFCPSKERRVHHDAESFPELQAATVALEKQIVLTEAEIDQMKETIASKKQLVRGWRKAIAAVNPKPPGQKKKSRTIVQALPQLAS